MTVKKLIEALNLCEPELTVFTVQDGYNCGGDDYFEVELTAVQTVEDYGQHWARGTEGKRAVKLIF